MNELTFENTRTTAGRTTNQDQKVVGRERLRLALDSFQPCRFSGCFGLFQRLREGHFTQSAVICLSLALLALLPCEPLFPQQRPLQSQDPAIISPGNISLEFGFDFLQDAKFPHSGLRGDLTSLGVIGINFGVGKMVEFQIQGTAHHFLSINQRTPAPINPRLNSSGTATSDFGDLLFSTKILMIREERHLPSIAFRPSVQLPNAKGLGLNSTQFFGTFLIGKQLGKLNTFANLGLGILANPIQAGVQNDVLIYGLAGIYPLTEKVNVASEVFGRWNTRKNSAPLGTESLSQFRLGLQLYGAGFRWDVAGIAGLTQKSPRSGITIGVTKEFRAFTLGHP